MLPALIPAELTFDGDGVPYSKQYKDVYHSRHGALAQARHVFLTGNALPERWNRASQFVILETGFGLGLNFLATWQAWRNSGSSCRLHFISVEKHPFRCDDLATGLTGFGELAPLSTELLEAWPLLTTGFHRLHFDDDRVSLTLLLGDAALLLPRLDARVDAVFLDGFSPAVNPEIWCPDVLRNLTNLCQSDATLSTWCVAGAQRRALIAEGWKVERQPGFAAKREMLKAHRSGSNAVPPKGTCFSAPPAPIFYAPEHDTKHSTQHAIVIGAGLAGANIAERLAARGWDIDVFEKHSAPAMEASGNPSGVVLPQLAKDDALAARFSRACYLYLIHRLTGLTDVDWTACGVLQIARDAAHEVMQQETIDALKLPSEFASFLSRHDAQQKLGHNVSHGGWWFPRGGSMNPSTLCAALLARHHNHVQCHFNVPVARLSWSAKNWSVHSPDGVCLASAPHVVLANAHAANLLLPTPLPMTSIRGQVSYISSSLLPDINTVLCRHGYLTPARDGTVCVGASFVNDDMDLTTRSTEHQENLQRLEEILPGSSSGLDAKSLCGRVGLRCATADRMPMIGSVADAATKPSGTPTLESIRRLSGLHVLLGLSARGIVWAPLAAELLASQMNNEPLPVDSNTVRAVDPARFYLRALRRA